MCTGHVHSIMARQAFMPHSIMRRVSPERAQRAEAATVC
jgi:hypothetical protein